MTRYTAKREYPYPNYKEKPYDVTYQSTMNALDDDVDPLWQHRIYNVDTIGTQASPGDLRQLEGEVNSIAVAKGFYAINDGGGGTFNWVVGAKADDGGTVIVPNGSSSGYWVRQFEGQTYNIKWFGCDPGLSDNGVIINSIIASLSGGVLPNTRKSIFIPSDGDYSIQTTIALEHAGDCAAKFGVYGEGGRRASVLKQTTANPVLSIKDTAASGVIRDIEVGYLTVQGGTIGIDIEDDDYIRVNNVVFNGQTTHGVYQDNAGYPTTIFESCWFLYQGGWNVETVSGGSKFINCVFGEGGAAFYARGAYLVLENCFVFDCENKAEPTGDWGEGNALFRLENGGSLITTGGRIAPNPNVDSVIVTSYPRDIMINGTDIVCNVCDNFIANRYVHTGTKPYPILTVRSDRISSANTSGINMYKQLITSGAPLTYVHNNALFDCMTEYKGTTPPTFDSYFTDPSNDNEIKIRSRPDQD
jgi:hypothetical protein